MHSPNQPRRNALASGPNVVTAGRCCAVLFDQDAFHVAGISP